MCEGRPLTTLTQASRPVDAAADKLALAVRHLTLSDFRCYERAVVEPGPGLNVFTGPNGAGKTNLLEAVSFLSPGRGLRRARLRDVTRTGAAGGWAAASRIATNFGELKIGTGIEPAANGTQDRRVVRIDGETVGGPAALAGYVTL